MTYFKTGLCAAAVVLSGSAASAEFAKVTDQSQFLQLVDGKTLTRPFVSLTVTPDGKIFGKGATWDITGIWSWNGEYFCRDMQWGGDELGYNCQEVAVSEKRIKFTSDKGAGDSAEFSLR